MNKEQMQVVAKLYAKNDELETQNKLLDKKCNEFQQENKELRNKIDKAIDLYKNCKAEDYCTLDLDMYNALIGGDIGE